MNLKLAGTSPCRHLSDASACDCACRPTSLFVHLSQLSS